MQAGNAPVRPHYTTLIALFGNDRVPAADRARRAEVFERYNTWVDAISNLDFNSFDDCIVESVRLLNDYKNFIDLDFSVDGARDQENKPWLYRNRGQTKHSSSIMEEYMVLMVENLFSEQIVGWSIGPKKTILSLNYNPIRNDSYEIQKIEKDIDFAIYREFEIENSSYAVAKVGLELKDHVDKTMMAGVSSDANTYSETFPSGFYALIAGWRDLGPDAYQPLPVGLSCFMLLRKQKRVFNPRTPEKLRRAWVENPFSSDVFIHLFNHIREVLENDDQEFENWINNLTLEYNQIQEQERTLIPLSHTSLDNDGFFH